MNLKEIENIQNNRSRISLKQGFGGYGKGVFNSRLVTLCQQHKIKESTVLDLVGAKLSDPDVDLRTLVNICLLLDTTPNYLLGFDGDDKCNSETTNKT